MTVIASFHVIGKLQLEYPRTSAAASARVGSSGATLPR
jgi:hypothetical protein